MIDAWRQINIAGQIPNLLQGVVIVDVAINTFHHHRNGQGISKVRVILERLNERIILRQ